MPTDRLPDVLAGIRAGVPATGPLHAHLDITNSCNAACVTCWDHSPLLDTPRPAAWKRRRLPRDRALAILDQLAAFGSVKGVVISGMGEPFTHPDVYDILAAVKRHGWRLTVMTNLVAADVDRLVAIGVDQVLVGVQGASPRAHTAFHPGWDESHFHRLCAGLRRLARTGATVRHVHVITHDLAREVPEMVRFGKTFGAERVNFKLASLAAGTEAVAITEADREWLLAEGIPAARALSARLGVRTNLDLFERQVRAGGRVTAPMDSIGCYMGYVYTRVTVDEEVLYCCNTEVRVGTLADGTLEDLWWGPAWQRLRDRLRLGDYLPGCERCGKLEQNVAWAARLAAS